LELQSLTPIVTLLLFARDERACALRQIHEYIYYTFFVTQ
jgi:hypothetical protein